MKSKIDKKLITGNISSIEECVYCHSFCKSSCPSFKISGNECFLPRNISYLASLLNKGDFKLSDSMIKIFYSCAACSLCEINCIYEKKDFIRTVAWIRGKVFKNNPEKIPGNIMKAVNNIKKTGNIFGKTDKIVKTEKYSLKSSAQDFLFPGCLINYVVPEILDNAVEIFKKNSFKLNIFEDEICCGAPLFYAGDMEFAKSSALKIKNRIDLKNIKRLIVFCPSCYDFIKNWYSVLGVEIQAEIIFYTEIIGSFYDNLRQDESEQINGNGRGKNIMFLEPAELRNNSKIIESVKKILLSLKGINNKDILLKNNFYTNCGGILNFNDKGKITDYLEEIKYISKIINSDLFVTISPICYYYMKQLEDSVRVREFADYLLKR